MVVIVGIVTVHNPQFSFLSLYDTPTYHNHSIKGLDTDEFSRLVQSSSFLFNVKSTVHP